MTLADVLDRCQQQVRLSPVITDDALVSWLQQSIRKFAIKSRWLDKWTVIPVKAGSAKYLLPGDHTTTVAAFYDETRLQQCTAFDTQFVSPTTPLYYYEDEWEDEASEGGVSEFVLQYALEDLWLFQLMRSQNSHGRKTITLLAAPVTDGDGGSAAVGLLDGTLTADTFYWPDTAGIPVAVMSTGTNLTLFYKAFDRLPETASDNAVWNDALGILYSMGAISLAMGTEDDEYDRYRAWLYDFMQSGVADALKGMAINARAK